MPGAASGSSRPRSRRAAMAIPTALARPWPSGPVVISTPVGVAVLGVARGLGVPGPQRLEVVQLETEAAQVELDVEGQAGVAAGQHEAVPAGPVGVGRVVPHHLLEQQVRHRGQAHRRAGVAVAHLLHGVGGEHPDGVDGSDVEVGPALRQDGCGGLARTHVDGPSDGGHADPLGCAYAKACSPAAYRGCRRRGSGPSAADRRRWRVSPAVEMRICGSGPRLTHDCRSTPGPAASRRRERLPW